MSALTATLTPSLGSDAFARRCAEAGVLAWQCDSGGAVVLEPDASGVLSQWLGSGAVRERVQAAAQAVGADRGAAPEIVSGCPVVVIADSRRPRREPFWLLMPIDAEAGASVFEPTCRAAGVEPAELLAALEPLAFHRRGDADRVIALLRAAHGDLRRSAREGRALGEFSDKLAQAYEETHLLFRLARFANCLSEPADLMQTFCHELKTILPFRWTAVRFDARSEEIPSLTGRLIVAGELPCDTALFDSTLGRLMSAWDADNWTRLWDPATNELAALVGSEIVIDPVTHDGRIIGALLAGNKQGSDPDLSSLETQFIDAAADFLGVFHENVARFSEQRALFLGTLRSLTASIDAKDAYTRGHSERVSMLAAQMAAALELGKAEVETFRIAGLVHDVGKIGVPEAVLSKSSRLTDDEFALIKKHPDIGYRILKDIPMLAAELPGVLHHHERWDGQGYPHKLAGEAIPLIARVLALADTFDAMSSTRAYRAALPRPQVLAEIEACGGRQFDPALIKAFVGLDFSPFDAMVERQRAAHLY
jgi:HD-GYP domain-containing protein (c-di-GMP phosphodiesterase class II)